MFQAVLLTNGRISFAAFIYSPQTIDLLDLRLRSVTFPTIGFFPKRESEMSLRLPVRENLQTEMMFRIEGMIIIIHICFNDSVSKHFSTSMSSYDLFRRPVQLATQQAPV